MTMRGGISALMFSKSGKQAAETARSSISELTGTTDLITITAGFAIGFLMALWLTLQFPVAESTAVFLAQFG